ncbi:MAG TPA: acyl-CoA dehydrogenase family protein [Kribbella sp.]|uniref:acyl-CoA dehydrogenase family protein n=1 Tax=Kribbella sp. TaxID=1871183 RepID=UPI002D79DF75|nr:acyl-CoA dehydrogenase family protein [Kribbella sp.]HET6295105.1 acyl-CoA dehydrogenase family protein [Kribbella sp.]
MPDGRGTRSAGSVARRLKELLVEGALELPDPGTGRTAERWMALLDLGRTDLALARLAEGHTDATSILRQAGQVPDPDALYGVWAARSGGTGAVLKGDRLGGTIRFCSGAHSVDRALIAAIAENGDSILVDQPLATPGITRDAGTWQPLGMDASDSPDVSFDDVAAGNQVGEPGFYTGRPGFWWGGGGVAAVWFGGSLGLVERTQDFITGGKGPDDHQLAHLGELQTSLAATGALLRETAATIDADPTADLMLRIWMLRAGAEQTARAVVDRVPRMVGPTPLSRDRSFSQALADLQLYVRQHHAERDYAALGRLVLDTVEGTR